MAGFCSVVLQDGWQQADLCSVVLLDGWLVFSSVAGQLAQAGLCSVVLQDGWSCMAVLMYGWPKLVFSSHILEGWLMLHLLMFISFIGRVTNTGLYLVVLLYAGWCSVVLLDGSPRWLVFNSFTGRVA